MRVYSRFRCISGLSPKQVASVIFRQFLKVWKELAEEREEKLKEKKEQERTEEKRKEQKEQKEQEEERLEKIQVSEKPVTVISDAYHKPIDIKA